MKVFEGGINPVRIATRRYEKSKMIVIDRFEGDFAVIETDNGMINIPRSELPTVAKEGDTLRIVIDTDDTDLRKKRIDGMMDELFKK